MIHGWGADHRYFEYQLEAFKDYKLIIPDLQGFGSSSTSPVVAKKFSIPEQAELIYQLARSQNIESAVIVGHSMGGMVAQELALSHPEFVSGLVLEGTSSGLKSHWRSSILSMLGPLIYLAVKPMRVFLAKRWAISNTYASETVKGLITEYASVTCCKVLVRYVKAMRKWSSLDRLHNIVIPCLIVHGSEDRLLGKVHTTLLQSNLQNARTIEMERSGHTPHLEIPEIFNGELKKYLKAINW